MKTEFNLSTEQLKVIERTEVYVKKTLQGDSSGHDWWHIERVRTMAVRLAEAEGANRFVVELGALLHDIADWKFHDGDPTIGGTRARQWLTKQGLDDAVCNDIGAIVSSVSFKGAGVKSELISLEGKVVQDADRLDAIGAIGIARTFAYGGHFNRSMYDPDVAPEQHNTFEQYKNNNGTTINHFYEKLLLLKGRLNTPAARSIAHERHRFMEEFLERFFDEWKGRR